MNKELKKKKIKALEKAKLAKEKETKEGVCFTYKDYTVSVDRYQYILSGVSRTGEKGKEGKEVVFKILGYYKFVSGAIRAIREIEMKRNLLNTSELKVAINRIEKMDKEFELFLKPLKRFENIESFDPTESEFENDI